MFSKLSLFMPLGETPLVSCVIIFYNNEAFLAEAIESVLIQTYPHWELFLIDDGSSDESSQIAKQYACTHAQKVRYLEHPFHQNRGKNASRNLGIQHAKGDLIALLDGDDYWLPNKLIEQVALCRRYPTVGMVCGRTQKWFSWTGNPDDKMLDHFIKPNVSSNTVIQPPTLVLSRVERGRQVARVSNAMFRQEVFNTIGYFDENYHDVFEDQTFLIKVELAFPVFVSDQWWSKSRQHSDADFNQFIMRVQRDKHYKHFIHLQFLKWVEAYLIEQNNQSTEIWQVLRSRQRWLKKRMMFQKILINHYWRAGLEWPIRLSRKVMPRNWREWLWESWVKRLYIK